MHPIRIIKTQIGKPRLQLHRLNTTMKPSKIDQGRFTLSCCTILIFLGILAFTNQPQLRFPPATDSTVTATATTRAQTNNSSSDNLRILIGILTLPDQYLRRHFLRLVYSTQPPPPGAKVDVKFVFCNLTKEDQKVLVALEIMHHDDIMILDCKENMNNGKTLNYFSTLPELLNDTVGPYPPYHYVMKADDDTYLRLNSLVESLKPLPREDLYYGYVIPCKSMDPFVKYMSGMGYLVSWDIVEWIRGSDIPRKRFQGPEDKVFGEWLREGRRGNNRFNAKWSMYNFPEPPTTCTHELWPDTIAVHLLKNQEKWIRTLKYFNVTRHLKPSKLYHIL
ncbi:hydroxyproline O-galactosyltransferase GALT3-like [Gastrolobium bilobum]|uniref:hydroxyproline O-galactosyltransferase GALT3-like n=1 Tax=Gastrolobium bilobum TaxID=150636 RepID=UPI002AB07A4C|nr:hydroxyproline O-galactosyltransferase GALT3-like [Gastrolobium bilobum]